jgi:hypothetical protein
MKKLFLLGAIGAVAYGAFKAFGGKKQDDDAIYGASSYTPTPAAGDQDTSYELHQQSYDSQQPYGTTTPSAEPQQP